MNYTTALVQLPLVRETGKSTVFKTPSDICALCADMSALAQESFQVITVNTKHRVINRHLVSLGTVDASLVHAREVFRPAIADGATSVVLVHNHPSGDPFPSSSDIRITANMIQAGQLIGIRVLDHVIIGTPALNRKAFYSLRESGQCKFT